MAHNNANLCPNENYCSMAAYCCRIHPEMRKYLLETSNQNAIDIEIFKANGSGKNFYESKKKRAQSIMGMGD